VLLKQEILQWFTIFTIQCMNICSICQQCLIEKAKFAFKKYKLHMKQAHLNICNNTSKRCQMKWCCSIIIHQINICTSILNIFKNRFHQQVFFSLSTIHFLHTINASIHFDASFLGAANCDAIKINNLKIKTIRVMTINTVLDEFT
jgi:hypothetical protein